jgi:hypothetical protein
VDLFTHPGDDGLIETNLDEINRLFTFLDSVDEFDRTTVWDRVEYPQLKASVLVSFTSIQHFATEYMDSVVSDWMSQCSVKVEKLTRPDWVSITAVFEDLLMHLFDIPRQEFGTGIDGDMYQRNVEMTWASAHNGQNMRNVFRENDQFMDALKELAITIPGIIRLTSDLKDRYKDMRESLQAQQAAWRVVPRRRRRAPVPTVSVDARPPQDQSGNFTVYQFENPNEHPSTPKLLGLRQIRLDELESLFNFSNAVATRDFEIADDLGRRADFGIDVSLVRDAFHRVMVCIVSSGKTYGYFRKTMNLTNKNKTFLMDFYERTQTFQEFVLSPKFVDDGQKMHFDETRAAFQDLLLSLFDIPREDGSVVKTNEDGEVTLAWKGTGEMIWRRIRDPGDCRHILQTNDALMTLLKFISLAMSLDVERICAIYRPMQTAIEHNWVREHASTRVAAAGGPGVVADTARVSALLQQLCVWPERLLS